MRLTPKQNDDFHVACQKLNDGGTLELRRSSTVAFLPERQPPGTPVTICGAPWCDACHIAADYMKQYGIPYVELDIEQDEVAKAKCESVLDRAGFGKKIKALPVLDVRGTILVGFSPCALEAAWAAP